ncbi:glycosyltransferase family 2 protein [Escherichia coli]|uniref:glycosyltransferase family 2 protein n=1 Tax=Escherichia coli TaxID=562 RepID=UPI001C5F39C6|nr:glycosyltransferase family 2 protein [Escherichia coli]ELH7560783.1 glycosyltransferase family 2 protein [Escherichia coli]MCH4702920.1 glycosyltransferase [Escherichia coli]MCH4721026.1 glycosyltransferase [Escherichia coli]MCH4739051.1 glycosyltransferase [Escherichia coli]MCZ0278703.1 glycosyltransferase family 2 protein [Escherichia coli]
MTNEIFSIIMPTYNAEKTILDSIDSVLQQDLESFVLYIINDASSDKTKDIILSLSDPRIIYLENENNLGVAESRNKGLKNANGMYIAFLDSDDLWLPNKLSSQLKILDSGWDVVCSNYIAFDSAQTEFLRTSPEIIQYSDMLKSNFIGNLTGVYNRQKLGVFLQKNIGHEDYVMWLQIIKKSRKAFCIQSPLAKYRLSNNSLSGNKFRAISWQWSIYRNELQLSILKSSYYFSHYILNALKKRR